MSNNKPPSASGPRVAHGYTAARSLLLSVAKLFMLGFLPLLRAAPQLRGPFNAFAEDEEPPMSPEKPTLWIYLAVAIALVLLGGAFAGLTIALMGQVSYGSTVGSDKQGQELIKSRMKYTYKSSKRLVKDLRGTMLLKYYGC